MDKVPDFRSQGQGFESGELHLLSGAKDKKGKGQGQYLANRTSYDKMDDRFDMTFG